MPSTRTSGEVLTVSLHRQLSQISIILGCCCSFTTESRDADLLPVEGTCRIEGRLFTGGKFQVPKPKQPPMLGLEMRLITLCLVHQR